MAGVILVIEAFKLARDGASFWAIRGLIKANRHGEPVPASLGEDHSTAEAGPANAKGAAALFKVDGPNRALTH